MKWTLIYHDGDKTISTVSSEEMDWEDAPNNNVQYIILETCKRRRVIGGQDEYYIKTPNTSRKFGSLISKAEHKRVRKFMIYGKY